MTVQNIECQIAKGQMSRYLAGDNFSPDMAVELRAHIAECPDCAAALDRKRQILQAMLTSTGPVAVVQIEERRSADEETSTAETEPRPRASASFKLALSQLLNLRKSPVPTVREPATPVRNYWRPLAYSAGLATVLIAMSMIMRDPTRLLGERAINENTPASTIDATAKSPSAPKGTSSEPLRDKKDTPTGGGQSPLPSATSPEGTASNAPAASAKLTTGTNSSQNQVPGNDPSAAPSADKVLTPRVSRPRPHKNTRKSGTTPRPQSSGIRVYDANGNPIQ